MSVIKGQNPLPSNVPSRIHSTLAWSAQPDGSLDFVNQQFRDYLGSSSDQSYGLHWKSAVHQDDIEQLEAWWQGRLQSREAGTTVVRLRRFDGRYRWFQIAAAPVYDQHDNLVSWCGINTDIDELKCPEQKIGQEGVDLAITDAVPIALSVLAPDGTTLYLNRMALDRMGVMLDEVKGKEQLSRICHRDDLDRIGDERRKGLSKGVPFELEMRLLNKSGEYRWHLTQYNPLVDERGQVSRWYVTAIDIEDRKRAERALQQAQLYLSEGQRLAHLGSWAFNGAGFSYWSAELFQIHGLDPRGKPPTVEEYLNLVHPDDREFMKQGIQRMLADHRGFDFTKRIVRPDGELRYVRCVGVPAAEGATFQGFVGTAMDVTEQEQFVQKLRQKEADLRTITDSIPQPIVVLTPDGTPIYVNQVALNLTGFSMDQLDEKGYWERVVHADDVMRLRGERQEKLLRAVPFELEFRALFKSGQYRWQLMQYNPLKDESGQTIRWYATATDIDDLKRAEQKLRQSEADLRTITDAIRQVVVVLAPDGTTLYANKVACEQIGLTLDEVIKEGFTTRALHPDDVDRVDEKRQLGLLEGVPFELEARIAFKNGHIRWQLLQYNPLKDESGQIIRWYATATDIDDQKKTEERLRNENLVLREEVDRSSMFEEIVGSSKPMGQLLRKVEKVAPSDSTVLILGETGTGKELIARALHRRSKRASRAFVKVNCAAIPQSLIASELFGHEKGAFTGALQRRVGRFEAANGGTLFLDEIGELPMETQIALLRVLQEREFERVGSNHPISVDVRLIAATNRDLPAAVAAGTFRQDLFYRLNVFPIAVAPLRERAEDIPLLVEYFVARYASEAGKSIRHISRQTLDQLSSYGWPGNIRELQNVVERAVILSETDTFVVEESWLAGESQGSSSRDGLSRLAESEVETIEAALAEAHGRISGPTGAAAKLGIPRQTLESKIRRLGIDKYGQKRPAS